MQILIHSNVEEKDIVNTMILSKYKGKWLYCKRRGCLTYEFPQGRRERGEDIEETAHRVLSECTGARKYELIPICTYSVTDNGVTEYGKLYFGGVVDLGSKPSGSIERIYYLDAHPERLTYPEVHSILVAEAKRKGIE